MNKFFVALISTLIVVLVIVGLVWFLSSGYKVTVEKLSGEVFYKNSKTNYEYQKIDSLVKVPIETWVKTEDGKAKITFKDGFYCVLDKSTEVFLISLKENVATLKQTEGQVWYRAYNFAKPADFNIIIGDKIIEARGTAFSVTLLNNGFRVKVVDGEIRVYSKDRIYTIPEGNELIFSNDLGSVRTMSSDDWINQNLQNDESYIEQRKEELRQQYKKIIEMVKEKYDIDENTIDYYLTIAATEGTEAVKKEIEKDFNIKIPNWIGG